MSNKILVIVGIILLSSALIFGHLTGQTKAFAQQGCGGCCAVTSAPTDQVQCNVDCSGMQCQMCKCCTGGPAKEAFNKYMADTAGLRKELADARTELDAAMRKRPIDRASVVSTVDRVNALQGKLNRQTAEFMVDTCGSMSPDECCKMCRPSACIMMLADECPMKVMACKGMKGCCGMPGGNSK
jgi:hypothetical protein